MLAILVFFVKNSTKDADITPALSPNNNPSFYQPEPIENSKKIQKPQSSSQNLLFPLTINPKYKDGIVSFTNPSNKKKYEIPMLAFGEWKDIETVPYEDTVCVNNKCTSKTKYVEEGIILKKEGDQCTIEVSEISWKPFTFNTETQETITFMSPEIKTTQQTGLCGYLQ